jgi:transglutaminase-like putative cysteine protease
MKLRVHHRTEYVYPQPAHHNNNELRLQPLHNAWQKRRFHLLRVLPSARLNRYADFYANGVHHFEVEEAHQRLIIEVDSVVETQNRYSGDLPLGVSLSSITEDTCERNECHMFLQESRYVRIPPEIWRAAIDARGDEDDVFLIARNLIAFVHRRSKYVPGVTNVSTRSDQFFESMQGVCQDYTHLALALCRSLKIPARYVSGYLYDPTRREMRGAHASHAWIEVFIPGFGWHAMDPTNDLLADDHYIAIATGRDYDDVAPVKGAYYGGGSPQLNVLVHVDEE